MLETYKIGGSFERFHAFFLRSSCGPMCTCTYVVVVGGGGGGSLGRVRFKKNEKGRRSFVAHCTCVREAQFFSQEIFLIRQCFVTCLFGFFVLKKQFQMCLLQSI